MLRSSRTIALRGTLAAPHATGFRLLRTGISVVRKTLLHDITEVRVRSRGYLPHWRQPNATYSLTIRLDDSLPRAVIDRLRDEHRAMRHAITGGLRKLTAIEKADVRARLDLAVDRELHRGMGSAAMNAPAIADLVANTLLFFDGARYQLDAWCVMPNHVHAVITPGDRWQLDTIVHSWKSYSARMANRLLQRHGTFWQREYFDRIIRDEKDLAGCIGYVLENPTKAGLTNWRWTSAAWNTEGG